MIFRLKSVKSKKLNTFLKNTQKELSDFFGVKIYFPGVFLINSRKQYDDVWGTKSEDWMVGGANGRNIFILDYKVFTKESNHKDTENFWLVLKHEYCHLAIKQYCGHSRPRWINEGLCCYFANQVKGKPTLKESLKVFDFYLKSDWQIYYMGTFWVKLLLDRFGKKKMLKLIKSLKSDNTEKEFVEIFHKVYGFKYNKEEFSKLYS